MNSAASIFAMGGYGFYIWTSYAVTALVILCLFVWSHWGLRNAEKREAQLGRRQRRKPRRETSS